MISLNLFCCHVLCQYVFFAFTNSKQWGHICGRTLLIYIFPCLGGQDYILRKK